MNTLSVGLFASIQDAGIEACTHKALRRTTALCRLLRQKRTLIGTARMSALCHKRTSSPDLSRS